MVLSLIELHACLVSIACIFRNNPLWALPIPFKEETVARSIIIHMMLGKYQCTHVTFVWLIYFAR
jgi:hypothetical protein